MAISGKLEGFEKKIEWSIPDFFILAEKKSTVDSPNFFVGNFNASWHLRIYTRWNGKDNFMALFLYRDQAVEYEVECSLGLKKSDLCVVHLGNAILRKGQHWTDCNDLIEKKELLDKKSELVPGNTLTVICIIKFGTQTAYSIQKPSLYETKSSKLSKLDKLSENFKDIYADKETCDVILKVKDKEFKAHRIVLMARSHVFSAAFKHDTQRQTGIITISDCDPESFEKFLEYLYSGELEELSFRSALNLYYTSNKYDIEELKVYCVDHLKQSLAVENVCEIASLADKHSETKLFSAVLDFFNVNSSHIFLDSGWKTLLKNDPNLVDKLLTGMAEMKRKK